MKSFDLFLRFVSTIVSPCLVVRPRDVLAGMEDTIKSQLESGERIVPMDFTEPDVDLGIVDWMEDRHSDVVLLRLNDVISCDCDWSVIKNCLNFEHDGGLLYVLYCRFVLERLLQTDQIFEIDGALYDWFFRHQGVLIEFRQPIVIQGWPNARKYHCLRWNCGHLVHMEREQHKTIKGEDWFKCCSVELLQVFQKDRMGDFYTELLLAQFDNNPGVFVLPPVHVWWRRSEFNLSVLNLSADHCTGSSSVNLSWDATGIDLAGQFLGAKLNLVAMEGLRLTDGGGYSFDQLNEASVQYVLAVQQLSSYKPQRLSDMVPQGSGWCVLLDADNISPKGAASWTRVLDGRDVTIRAYMERQKVHAFGLRNLVVTPFDGQGKDGADDLIVDHMRECGSNHVVSTLDKKLMARVERMAQERGTKVRICQGRDMDSCYREAQEFERNCLFEKQTSLFNPKPLQKNEYESALERLEKVVFDPQTKPILKDPYEEKIKEIWEAKRRLADEHVDILNRLGEVTKRSLALDGQLKSLQEEQKFHFKFHPQGGKVIIDGVELAPPSDVDQDGSITHLKQKIEEFEVELREEEKESYFQYTMRKLRMWWLPEPSGDDLISVAEPKSSWLPKMEIPLNITLSKESLKEIDARLKQAVDEVRQTGSVMVAQVGEKVSSTVSDRAAYFDEKYGARLGKVGDKIESVVDMFASFKPIVSGFCKSNGLVDDFGDMLIVFVHTMINAYFAPNWALRFSIVMQSILALRLFSLSGMVHRAAKVVTALLSRMKTQEEKSNGEEVKPNGDDVQASDEELVSAFWEMISMGFFELSGKEVVPNSSGPMDSINKHAKALGSVVTITKGVEYLSKLVYDALGWAYLKVYDKPFSFGPHAPMMERATQWMTATQGLKDDMKATGESFCTSFATCVKVKELKKEGQCIAKDLLNSGWSLSNFGPFFKAQTDFEKVAADAKRAMTCAGSRVPPVVIRLDGKPKRGKSVVSLKMARDLYRLYCHCKGIPYTKMEKKDLIYVRRIEQEYWDNYDGQPIVLLDDSFQNKDPQILTRVGAEIITMCNSVAFPLHMSELSEKKGTYFDSKILILTNNKTGIPSEMQIADKMALARRWDVHKWVDIKPEFTDHRGFLREGLALSTEYYIFRNITSIYVHSTTDVDDKVDRESEGIGYDDLMRECARVMVRRVGEIDRLSQFLESDSLDVEALYKSVLPQAGPVTKIVYPKDEYVLTHGESASFITSTREFRTARIVKAAVEWNNGNLSMEKKFVDTISLPLGSTIRIFDLKGVRYFVRQNGSYMYELTPDMEEYIELLPAIPSGEDWKGGSEEFKKKFNTMAQSLTMLSLQTSMVEGQVKALKEQTTSNSKNLAIVNTVMVMAACAVTLSGVGMLVKNIVSYFTTPTPNAVQMFSSKGTAVVSETNKPGVELVKRELSVVQVPNCKVVAMLPLSSVQTEIVPNGRAEAIKEVLLGKIANNYVDFRIGTVRGENVEYRSCKALFLYDFCFMTVKHMLCYLTGPDDFIEIQCYRDFVKGKIQVYRWKSKELASQILHDKVSDLAFFYPLNNKGLQKFPNILHLFAPANKILNCDISRAYIFSRTCKDVQPEIRYASNVRRTGSISYQVTNDVVLSQADIVTYSAPSYDGDCGSIGFFDNDEFQGAKIGFLHSHGTRDQKEGGGPILTQEFLASVKEYFDSIPRSNAALSCSYEEEWVVPESRNQECPLEIGWNLEYIGKVRKELAHRLPSDTEIEASIFQNKIQPPKRFPAHFAPIKEKGIYPLQNSVTKLTPIKPSEEAPNQALYAEVVEHIVSQVGCKLSPMVLPIVWAINGAENRQLPGLHMRKAIGWLGVVKTGGDKINYFIKVDPPKGSPRQEYFVFNDLLCNKYQKRLKRNLECEPKGGGQIGEGNLKQETREPEKVYTPRIFITNEVDHVVQMKQFFGSFMENLALYVYETGVAMGINVHSPEFGKILQDCIALGDWETLVGIDLDVRRFDVSTKKYQHLAYVNSINRWYERFMLKWGLATRVDGVVYVKYPEHLEHSQLKHLIKDLCGDRVPIEVHHRIRIALVMDSSSHVILLLFDILVRVDSMNFTGTADTFVRNSVIQKANVATWVLTRMYRVQDAIDAGDLMEAAQLLKEDISMVKFFLEKMGGSFRLSVRQFFQLCRIWTGGDDVMAMFAACMRWLKFPMLIEEGKRAGYDVTTPNKDGTMYNQKTVWELIFLMRSFRLENGIIFAPMELTHVLEILSWKTKGIPDEKASQEIVDVVFLEFMHHGRAVFEQYKDIINGILMDYGYPPNTNSFEHYLDQFLQGTGLCVELQLTRQQVVLPQGSALAQHVLMNWEEGSIVAESAEYILYKYHAQSTEATTTVLTPEAEPTMEGGGTVEMKSLQPADEAPVPSRRIVPWMIGDTPNANITNSEDPIFTREYQIYHTDWSGDDVIGSEKVRLVFPYDIMNVVSNIQEKLNRNHLVRADIILRTQINAIPSFYGALQGSSLTHTTSNSTDQIKLKDLRIASTCNAFILDANADKPVSFAIPYISPHKFWTDDLWTTKDAYFGIYILKVLAPLRAQLLGDTPKVQITVFASFRNVELEAPTLNSHITPIWKYVPNMKKEQVKKSTSGIVTQALDAVSSIGGLVMKAPPVMPEVNIVAGAAKMGAKLLSGATKMLGLNNPTNLETVRPVAPTTANGLSTGEGCLTQQVLTLSPTAAIASGPEQFGRTMDEMDINHIKRKPGLVDVFTISTEATSGEIIWSINVCPSTCAVYSQVTANEYHVYHTPVSWVTENFDKWTGDMDYLFVIFGSKMQQCVLRWAWHPSASEVPASYTDGMGDFRQKQVEICGTTYVPVRICYNQGKPYLQVNEPWDKTSPGFANGKLTVSIVNPLITASIVGTTSIYCAVYVAGGPSLSYLFFKEKRNPFGKHKFIATDTFTEVGTYVPQGETEGFKTSAFLDEIFSQDFPELIPTPPTQMTKQIYQGEEYASIRTMLHRFQLLKTSTFVHNTWQKIHIEDEMGYTYPYATFFNMCRYYFMYRKGGFNLKVFRSGDTNNGPGTLLATLITKTDTTPYAYDTAFGRNGTIVEDFELKPSLEFNLPYMEQYPMIPNPPRIAGEEGATCVTFLWAGRGGSPPKDLEAFVFYAPADDFSMAWAHGTPIVLVQGSAPERNGKSSGGREQSRVPSGSDNNVRKDEFKPELVHVNRFQKM